MAGRVDRGTGKGLMRGRDRRCWQAEVRYVPGFENRSHSISIGAKLRNFCNGTRLRYVFRHQ